MVRSTDLILADNHSCVAISLRPGQVRLGWPLPSSPLWNEPIPTLSPHTHILNQVVDITLSWAPHHSLFSPLLRQGEATLAGWGYQWCLQWEFPYLLTSPRPHTPTWSRLLWTPYPGRAKWTSTDHHQTSGGERTTPTTEILYTDVTTQGPPASTVSAQLATVSSQQCATCPSLIAIHLTGPSSGTRCEKEHHSSPQSTKAPRSRRHPSHSSPGPYATTGINSMEPSGLTDHLLRRTDTMRRGEGEKKRPIHHNWQLNYHQVEPAVWTWFLQSQIQGQTSAGQQQSRNFSHMMGACCGTVCCSLPGSVVTLTPSHVYKKHHVPDVVHHNWQVSNYHQVEVSTESRLVSLTPDHLLRRHMRGKTSLRPRRHSSRLQQLNYHRVEPAVWTWSPLQSQGQTSHGGDFSLLTVQHNAWWVHAVK